MRRIVFALLMIQAPLLRCQTTDKPLSLEDAIQEALSKNLDLAAARLNISVTEARRITAGFGSQGHVHRKRLFGVSDDRPVVISVVDTEEKIRSIAASVRQMVREGLVTIQPVDVVD